MSCSVKLSMKKSFNLGAWSDSLRLICHNFGQDLDFKAIKTSSLKPYGVPA